jgi:hypothetical protein
LTKTFLASPRFARVTRILLPLLRAASVFATGLAVGMAFVACEPAPAKNPTGPGVATPNARIESFSLAPESLHVDKIGMRDGALKPDGSLDIVFLARISGPTKSIFISMANEACDPVGGFRASTATGNEPAPAELGGALELGRMSGGIAVEEGGRFLNGDNGSIALTAGTHDVKLYVSNLGTLRDGVTVCAYALGADGSLVRSPPLKY